MRKAIVIAAALALGGCVTAEMDGFADIAASSEVVRIEGVGWGRSGDFALTPLGVAGTFKRSAVSTTSNGDKLAEGRVTFDLAGHGEFGGMQGECAYSRETLETSERASRNVTIDTSMLTGPYVMTCGFFRGNSDIGGIEVREQLGDAFDGRVRRAGYGEAGGAELRLTSVHDIAGTRIPSGTPLGYAMEFRNGDRAMLYSNGSSRQIALPHEGRDERAVALMAGIALALVWDPGDGE